MIALGVRYEVPTAAGLYTGWLHKLFKTEW